MSNCNFIPSPNLVSFHREVGGVADCAEQIADRALYFLRSVSGKSYRVTTDLQFQPIESLSKIKRVVLGTLFLTLLLPLTLPLTLIGMVARKFSHTHQSEYTRLSNYVPLLPSLVLPLEEVEEVKEESVLQIPMDLVIKEGLEESSLDLDFIEPTHAMTTLVLKSVINSYDEKLVELMNAGQNVDYLLPSITREIKRMCWKTIPRELLSPTVNSIVSQLLNSDLSQAPLSAYLRSCIQAPTPNLLLENEVKGGYVDLKEWINIPVTHVPLSKLDEAIELEKKEGSQEEGYLSVLGSIWGTSHTWQERKQRIIMIEVIRSLAGKIANIRDVDRLIETQLLESKDDIFSSICEKIDEEGDGNLQKLALAPFQTLLYPTEIQTGSGYYHRRDFLFSMEAVYNSTEYQDQRTRREFSPASVLIQQLGEILFADVNLYDFSEHAVAAFTSTPLPVVIGNASLKDGVEEDFRQIDLTPSKMKSSKAFIGLGKAAGHLNIGFAPLRDNNFSSLFYTDRYSFDYKEKEIKCLRFGTPTSQGYLWGGATILPEFRLMLDSYLREGKKHIYYNHQNPFSKAAFKGDETARVKAIIDLESEYPDTFYVFNFPFDGDFFNQKGEYAHSCWEDTSTFKAEFFRKLSNGSAEGYHIPKDIVDLSSLIDDSLNQIEAHYFPGKATLSKDERIAFQLITYSILEERYNLILEADSYNSSCKDAIDRGGVINGLRYYLHLLQTGKEEDLSEQWKFRVLLHSPALMVKEQPVIKKRANLLLATLAHLEALTPEQKELIRRFHRESKVEHTIMISHLPDQSFSLKCANARSDKEYISILDKYLPSKGEAQLLSRSSRYIEQFIKSVGEDTGFTSRFPASDGTPLPSQLERDFLRQEYRLNGEKVEVDSTDSKESVKRFFTNLQLICNQDEAEKIALLCTQATVANMTAQLHQQFTNTYLFHTLTQKREVNAGEKNTCFELVIDEDGSKQLYISQSYQITNINNGELVREFQAISKIDIYTEEEELFTKR